MAAVKDAVLTRLVGVVEQGLSWCRRFCGYEAGTNQPTIDALRNLALALGTSTDQLLFEPDERGPDNDLALAFEGASTRLDPEGRAHLKATLEGLLLRTEARHWAS